MIEREKFISAAEQCVEVVEQGWQQGGFHNEDLTQSCAVGAVHRVAKDDYALSLTLQNELSKVVLGRPLTEPMMSPDVLFKWNDTPGRTQTEVADAFRMVAKNISNGGDV